ncbi:MAG: HAMP domain-containing histidine kinase [Prolixibacteraceae bacterium]|nr:HAMP domain-containing histidine kinase [Prolixibacteraceae bacterium]
MVFVVAAVIEHELLNEHPENHLVNNFQKVLVENEMKLLENIDKIGEVILSEDFDGDFFESLKDYNAQVDQSGLGYLVYDTANIVYWSDRAIAFYGDVNEFKTRKGLVKMRNGYYLAMSKVVGMYEIVGLHLIKYNYEHENKYLHNKFFKDYRLPEFYDISDEKSDHAFPVIGLNNEFLFSIVPQGDFLCNQSQLFIPGIIYLIGILLLLIFFRREFLESNTNLFLRLLGLGAALFIVYWLHLIFNIPAALKHMPFFSPDVFGHSTWLPSLGDYFIVVLFFSFWTHNFTTEINLEKMKQDTALSKEMIVFLLLLFASSLFLLANYFIEILVYNSTISFSLNRIISISIETVVGIFSIGLMLLANVLFTLKIIKEACRNCRMPIMFSMLTGIVVFLAAIQYLSVNRITWYALAFFWIIAVLGILFRRGYMKKYVLSTLIIFVSVASFYSLSVLYQAIRNDERASQKLFAVNLSVERDPAAEEFLSWINNQIKEDPAIKSLIGQNDDPNEYIERTYFNSYFHKYSREIFLCDRNSTLKVGSENREDLCLPYMESMIQNNGVAIAGTNFYFINNMNGRISYTGRFEYTDSNDSVFITMYINLNSELLFEGIGFPELLIDKSITRSEDYRKFNYAKYFGSELTDKYGDYNYNIHIDNYRPSESEFTFRKWDKMEHLIYHTHQNNYVIVSRDIITFNDYLISFPYLFVFYFISMLVIMFIGSRRLRRQRLVFDLKFRIQAAIISIVFVSLLLVASVTIYYNVEEYKSRHQSDLEDKMKSIAEEIDMKLNDHEAITEDLIDWLNEELAKLSNIFQTDINVYGTDGDILASSRPEIFDRGLVSTRMNSQAYYEIFMNFNNYFQPERIGRLSYLSAYKLIINGVGDPLGAINLPYFIKQDKYSQEISTLVVAFINLYVLLFLASIIVAVIIANQITRPLTLIQENLQKMTLGKRNKPIAYSRNDEIGSLVKEYNKKVEELSVSADLLARSERESAWREMAKQIAHEIKNPLTPMKLNIQHLQRTRGQNKEYNAYLERVTTTLIEQIDNLSNIATEFSNFAKIPLARNQVFVLAEQLQKVIDLYETHNRAHIIFNPGDCKKIKVNADKEQLSRAIINLIKNSIQSIPDDKVGTITITLKKVDDAVQIAVADDGSGIPKELQGKMFSPSFTTKTSGMGLGLSIVKNIVENFMGTIWFETKPGVGTTFFIEIPFIEDSEEQ